MGKLSHNHHTHTLPTPPTMYQSVPLSCSPPPHASLSSLLHFLLLSPCPPRLLFAAVDLLFLLTLVFTFLYRRHQISGPGTNNTDPNPLLPKPEVRTNFRFRLACLASLIVAASYAYASYRALSGALPASSSATKGWRSTELFFFVAHCLSYVCVIAIVVNERRVLAAQHPLVLRRYWMVSFVITTLLFVASVLRFVAGEPIVPDDIMALASFPSSLILLFLAVSGSTGISLVNPQPEPLY